MLLMLMTYFGPEFELGVFIGHFCYRGFRDVLF